MSSFEAKGKVSQAPAPRRRRNPDAPMTTNQMVALFRQVVEGPPPLPKKGG